MADIVFLLCIVSSLQLPFPIKIEISTQIAQALMFLHTASPPTVHLDVKPVNILVYSYYHENTCKSL